MEQTVSNQRGIVLLVVLWAIALLSMLLVAASASVHGNLALSRSLMRDFKSERLAQSGMEIAAANLLTLSPQGRWIADGRRYVLVLGGDQIGIRVRDVTGLVDINRADMDVIRGLLRRFASDMGEVDAICAAIEQRRGPLTATGQDPAGSVGLESHHRPRLAPTRPLRSLAELDQVFGGDDELRARISPFVTVIGRTGAINPATAPEDVLAAIPDISGQEVSVILNARGSGRILGTDARAVVAKYGRYFETASDGVYNVEVDGASARLRRSTIVLDPRGDAPFRILAWNW